MVLFGHFGDLVFLAYEAVDLVSSHTAPLEAWYWGLLLSTPASPRSLAGKPLAGFCATPIRRMPVLGITIVHVLR